MKNNQILLVSTGAPDSVEIARQEIESHIIRRTGSCITPGGESTGPDDSADLLLASLCNSGLGSLGTILNYVNNGVDGCGYSGPSSADFGPFHSSSLHSIGLSSSQVRINEILGILWKFEKLSWWNIRHLNHVLLSNLYLKIYLPEVLYGHESK